MQAHHDVMFGGPRRTGIALRHAWRIVACALLTAGGGCGGGGDGQPPPPDLSGVWAGAWQGSDPSAGGLGLVSGTWEVEITQGASSASGPVELLGDVDCMDGQMQTNPGTQSAVTGSVVRPPFCPWTINWLLTAINLGDGTASGNWTNALTTGSGTLSGTRIARLGGPRIRFVNPPGAKPGAIVTVSGLRLSGLIAGDGLEFSYSPQPALISADATKIVARVPSGVSTGPVRVLTDAGIASSPRPFSTDVTSPPVVLGQSSAAGLAPAALAVSPDGRKFYVADRGNRTIRVVRTSTLIDLLTTPVLVTGLPRSVVASPDGKRIYVAAAGAGVHILDAASAVGVATTLPLSINDEGRDNPQGLAISADGTLLLVSEGSSGGSVRLFRVSDMQELRSFSFPVDIAPLGVAFSPDGAQVFIAAANLTAGTAGTLEVFDAVTGSVVDSEPVGELPTAIAVAPDGNFVYVTNKASGTVSVYDTQTLAPAFTVTVGASPTGIAIGPDGMHIYVVNRGSNNVSVFQALTGIGEANSPLDVSSVAMEPVAIVINPMGTTAYVGAVATNPVVVEIGGMRTLTVARGGTGIGTIRSTNRAGIDCGTQCQAQYPVGSSVLLAATPASGSYFSSWSGANCSAIMLDANLNCVAIFNSNAPPPSSSSPPSSAGCFIATAAYGSDMADDVMTLRRFRDDTLLHWKAGREFVSFYYRHSPPLADYIRERDTLRAAVRGALRPLVFAIKHPALAIASALALLLLVLGWKRARKAA
jgi:YVTN family beta-propeller protein